ncbi:MarR family winged helix-turn-helix transcriptional regulator [Demequina mangrovi]|uniref:Transcriptional regulator, MarR family n=1 Tax=Demequina mangrovi TaxID=1043493 RepID=A0A1H7B151_9MICO|nr:MarR family transcriptional regulator [Demequina mangrovi]SEJ67880.1 transcriptional regulator, MarR family [Demequina mangrovi]
MPADASPVTEATIASSRALLGIVARSLVPAISEVTVPQFRVMVVLTQGGGLRMGDLAERIGVHPSTLTRTVERLEHGGWIVRAADQENRRQVRVDLTGKGKALVATVTDRRRAMIAEVIEAMAPAEREALRSGMEAFARAAGEPHAADLLELGI